MNNWELKRNPMLKTEKGWECIIDLKPDKYEYKFLVVDFNNKEEWVFDPENPSIETNCAERTNNVLIVGN